MKNDSPPRLTFWFLEHMIDEHVRYSALGDFEERFRDIALRKGYLPAYVFIWSQIFLLIPSFFKFFLHWSFEMLKNYFKLGLRNMVKHSGSSFINIAGLALGLSLFILVALYVQFELGFDGFHDKKDRIYRVEQILAHESHTEPTAGCPTALSFALAADIPDFEKITKVIRNNLFFTTPDNRKFRENDVFAVDNAFLEMFTFPLLKGDMSTALSEPFSLVITESLATRIFGADEPVGQTIEAGNEFDLKITGVIADVPANSHLRFNALLSVSTYPSLYAKDVFSRWGDNWVPLYVLLQPNQSYQETNEKLRTYLKKYQGERSRNELYLRPLKEIHLHADVSGEFAVVGSIKNVNIFSAISIFVLLIACINFMNLATARSADRAREVGLRKVVGALRTSLMKQFLAESILIVFLSMVLAVLLARLFLPEFNQIVNRQLSLDLAGNWVFTLGLLCLTVFVGILAGFYPATILSSYRPVQVLRGKVSSGARNVLLRKFLVVFQFSISIGLIIGATIILQQNNFLMTKDLGYSTEQILVIPGAGSPEKAETLRTELKRNPNVLQVAMHDYMPHSSTNWTYVTWEGAGPEDYMKMNVNYVDEFFIPTYQMTMAEGREFNSNMRTWKDNAVILNESAARQIGWENPVGKRIVYNVDYKSRTVGGATVVGVVKDFHFLSLHHTIGPIMMRLLPQNASGGNCSVKISTQNVPRTIAFIKNEFEKLFPESVFSHRFLDEDFQQLYLEERKAGRVILYLSILAICIACLGILGLSSYTTKQRTKEIGIRRIVGASVTHITLHLTKGFLQLVLLANILAWPIGYFAMTEWLKNFPYRTEIHWLVFVLAGFAAVVFAFGTVAYHAVRAARANPVDSLRYE